MPLQLLGWGIQVVGIRIYGVRLGPIWLSLGLILHGLREYLVRWALLDAARGRQECRESLGRRGDGEAHVRRVEPGETLLTNHIDGNLRQAKNSSTCNEKWKANVEDQMAVDWGSPPRLLVQRKKLRICWESWEHARRKMGRTHKSSS